MKTALKISIALLLMTIFFVSMPASATEAGSAGGEKILITFDNKSAGRPALSGRNYRYRTRYRISATAKRDARAIAAEYELKAIDDWPIESLHVYCVVFEPGKSELLADLIVRLAADPRVESVQQMNRFQGMASPSTDYNDSYAGFQHGLRSMNVLQAHRYARGYGVRIAIVDTGIDRNHEDLSNNDIQVRNFVADGQKQSTGEHGTAVISVIAASPNNRKGIVGVAPGAELVALGACWSETGREVAFCDSFTLAKAMDFLIQSPPDLVNLSIAGPRDALLGRLIDAALQNGTVIVAAAPGAADSSQVYPAGFPGVIAIRSAPATIGQAVAQVNAAGAIHAPGEQIMVALPDDAYDFRSGSSLATANASGVIALLLEHAPDLDNTKITEILQQTQNRTGGTTINACRALAEIGVASTCQ